MSMKRHKYGPNGKPQATFEDLTYDEQSKSIRMTEINLRKMKEAHKRRPIEEGRKVD